MAVASLIIAVRVRPRAGKNAVTGWVEDTDGHRALEITVTALPHDGAANDAVLRVLADYLDVSKSALRLHRGGQSRYKRFELTVQDMAKSGRITALIGA